MCFMGFREFYLGLTGLFAQRHYTRGGFMGLEGFLELACESFRGF